MYPCLQADVQAKPLRCKNYSECRNVTPSPTGHKCWERWQLCGDCAVRKHPDEYPLLKKIQKVSPFWSRRNRIIVKGKVFYRGIKPSLHCTLFDNGRNSRVLGKALYKRDRWQYLEKHNGQIRTRDSILLYAVTTSAVGVASFVAVKQRLPTSDTVRCVVRRLRGTKRVPRIVPYLLLKGQKVARKFWYRTYH